MTVCTYCNNGARATPCPKCNLTNNETVVSCPGCGANVGERHRSGCVYRAAQVMQRGLRNAREGHAERQFLSDVLDEVASARAAFPDQDSRITGLALGEESGEAQRALLHIWEGKGGEAPLRLECVQAAAMALRLALESADRVSWSGNVAEAAGYLRKPDARPAGHFDYEVGSGGPVCQCAYCCAPLSPADNPVSDEAARAVGDMLHRDAIDFYKGG